jgi:hypothetical protein
LERKTRGDFFEELDFFPESKVDQRVSELREWIKSVGVKDFDTYPLDAKALSKVSDFVKFYSLFLIINKYIGCRKAN